MENAGMKISFERPSRFVDKSTKPLCRKGLFDFSLLTKTQIRSKFTLRWQTEAGDSDRKKRPLGRPGMLPGLLKPSILGDEAKLHSDDWDTFGMPAPNGAGAINGAIQ